MQNSISCVIPAYNEATRICNVLKAIKDYPRFMEIIVVNDGSKDKTSEVVKNFIRTNNVKHIKLIDLVKNSGKTNAVKVGVEASKGTITVLLDADLSGLTHNHLDRLIDPVLKGEYGLTILDRPTDRRSIIGWTGLTRLYGGERAFYREEFLQIEIDNSAGYSLETIMNMHYLKKGIKVRTVFAKDLETATHIKKDGLIKGTKLYLRMFWDIYKRTKIRNFYIQASDIEDDHLEELYKLYEKVKRKQLIRGFMFSAVLIAGVSIFLTLNVKNLYKKVRDITKKS